MEFFNCFKLPLCSWPLKAKEKVHASNKVFERFEQQKYMSHDDSQSIPSASFLIFLPEAKAEVTKELKESWLDTAANSLCGGLVASTPSKSNITNIAFWRSKAKSQLYSVFGLFLWYPKPALAHHPEDGNEDLSTRASTAKSLYLQAIDCHRYVIQNVIHTHWLIPFP